MADQQFLHCITAAADGDVDVESVVNVLSSPAKNSNFYIAGGPSVGSEVERIDPLRFLAGCRKGD